MEAEKETLRFAEEGSNFLSQVYHMKWLEAGTESWSGRKMLSILR
jgi:hypothetical protein